MNTETHYLGKPCRRGHVTECGKHTVRRNDNGSCEACVAIMRKAKFSRQVAANGSTYEGTACIRNHLTPSGKTLRWSGGGMCIECSKTFKKNWNKSEAGQVSQRESHWRQKAMPEPTRPRPEVCECCGKENWAGKVLCLDHCHNSAVFRGWLCTKCNAGIGHLGDSLEGVLLAADYLRKNAPAV